MTLHDEETNKVYFSKLLKEWYPNFTKELEKMLTKHNLVYTFIDGTKDIWMRDYMPIQNDRGKYIRYIHNPDYLNTLPRYKTSPIIATKEIKELEIVDISLNLDGGNIVRGKDKIICTDKIFVENPDLSCEQIIFILKESLGINEVIIIPQQPGDKTGHSDGIVRFITDEKVLVATLSEEDKQYESKLLEALYKANLEVILLRVSQSFYDKTDWAIYMNYLHIGRYIFLPVLTGSEFDFDNNKVIDRMVNIFSDCVIEPIYSDDISKDGGALNCISWNIKEIENAH